MIETLQTLSGVCFVLAGIFFAITAALFKIFQIPFLVETLTGRHTQQPILEFHIDQELEFTSVMERIEIEQEAFARTCM